MYVVISEVEGKYLTPLVIRFCKQFLCKLKIVISGFRDTKRVESNSNKVNYRIYCFRSHRNNACLLPVKIMQKSLLVSSHSIINKQKHLFQYLHSSYKNCADSMILAKKFSKFHTHNCNSYLNGYTKRRFTKYKLLLTISDISA